MQPFTLVQSLFLRETEMFVANLKQKTNLWISRVAFSLVSCRDVTIWDFGAMIISRDIISFSRLLWLFCRVYKWGCGLCCTPQRWNWNLTCVTNSFTSPAVVRHQTVSCSLPCDQKECVYCITSQVHPPEVCMTVWAGQEWPFVLCGKHILTCLWFCY